MTATTNEQAAAAPAGKNGFAIISSEKLLHLYATMVKCRMLEERSRPLLSESGFGVGQQPVKGQEASAVAVAIDLLPGDTIAPSHLDLILGFIQGASLNAVFRDVFAGISNSKAAGSRKKLRTASAGKIDRRSNVPSVGAHSLDAAIEAALAAKARKSRAIAVAFCDSLSTPPDLRDHALQLAAAKRLPILFVSRNRLASKPAGPDRRKGAATAPSDVPTVIVDGNDVVAVYRVATEAITHARKGSGPTVIECVSYPPNGRAALRSGKAGSSRQPDRPRSLDPIVNMERYLFGKDLLTRKIKLDVVSGFRDELDAAIKLLNS